VAVAHFCLVRRRLALVKLTIYRKVSRDKLARVLPKQFRVQLPRRLPEPITAVVFRDEVVTGRVARNALEKVASDIGASLVFAARDFTREATEAALGGGALLIPANSSWGGYFWTDSQLAESNTGMSTHRPLQSRPRDADSVETHDA
jgi:hypothetical protein